MNILFLVKGETEYKADRNTARCAVLLRQHYRNRRSDESRRMYTMEGGDESAYERSREAMQ
jgi:hypothetical protein